MDFSKLNDLELANLTANLADLLSGNELTSIDAQLRAELSDAFGTSPSDFSAEISAQAVANDEKLAATSAKNATRAKLESLARRTQFALKAGAADKEEFDLARLHYRRARSRAYIAQTPAGMSAMGFSNGVNIGRFYGNNRKTMVVYEIWRREGTDGAWAFHILTSKQSFKDENVTPGRYYEYRVRARARQNVSGFSNSTIVYGVL